MARRSLAGDDTGLLLSVPQPAPAHHSDADDDVMAISPPTCAPIDLSSSDERSTPLVDVKKENEGPTCAASRKPEALALREHNSTTSVSENTTPTSTDAAKPVKRRYSKPKLEIDMKDTQLEDSCKTNGIGEHVKLQKRRKVSIDQTSLMRVETVTKETKKKSPQTKRTPNTPSEKKTVKRKKSDSTSTTPKAKRMLMDSSDEKGLKSLAILAEDPASVKPKIKSALLLDNLIRKNSIDRASAKQLNPAELFGSLEENTSTTSKKTLNINNNIVESNPPVIGVRSNTIAAVSQLIEKKLSYKNACKLEKIDSKITHSSKSVLKPPTDKLKTNEDFALISDMYKSKSEKIMCKDSEIKSVSTIKDKGEPVKDNVEDLISDSDNKNNAAVEDALKSLKVSKPKPKAGNKDEVKVKPADESHITLDKPSETIESAENKPSDTQINKAKRCKLSTNKTKLKKSIEKVAKLLVSKKPVSKTDEIASGDDTSDKKEILEEILDKVSEKPIKLPKTNGELKAKSIERVAKLLVSKKNGTDLDSVPVPEDKEPTTKSIERITDITPEKTMPEKTLPKKCKLGNGEMKTKNVEKVVKLLVSKKPAIKTDEATLVIEDACASSPGPHVGRRARRRRSGAATRRVRRTLAPLAPPSLEPRAPPRWSNGWKWDGENYISKVYLNVSRNMGSNVYFMNYVVSTLIRNGERCFTTHVRFTTLSSV